MGFAISKGGNTSQNNQNNQQASLKINTTKAAATSRDEDESEDNEDNELMNQIRLEFKHLAKEEKQRQAQKLGEAEFGTGLNNKGLNRYTNVLPYDSSRVELKDGTYINASWIDEGYIATQGPIPATIDHFWQMVVETDARVIVMLTPLVERIMDRPVEKCTCYWPEDDQQEAQDYNGITVKLESKQTFEEYELRTFWVNDDHHVYHYYYHQWADFAVPQRPLRPFIEQVNSKADDKPVVVHCSAGIGRTGTYIAIDHVLKSRQPVYNVLSSIREKRPGMVQTIQQYAYIYQNTT